MVTADVLFEEKKVLVDLKGELWNARRGADDVLGMVLTAVERVNGRRSANAMVGTVVILIQVMVEWVVNS